MSRSIHDDAIVVDAHTPTVSPLFRRAVLIASALTVAQLSFPHGIIPSSFRLRAPPDAAHRSLDSQPIDASSLTLYQRAPYFLLMDTQIPRTTPSDLRSELEKHPSVLPRRAENRDLPFFEDRHSCCMGRTTTTDDGKSEWIVDGKLSYKHQYSRRFDFLSLKADPALVQFDTTSMFHSSFAPERVRAVVPWAKLIVALTNPIDRAYFHWIYARSETGVTETFEEWIEQDMRLLKQMGAIPDWTGVSFDEWHGSDAEGKAWERYTQRVGDRGVVGRGLYAVQLRRWFEEYGALEDKERRDERFLVLRRDGEADRPVISEVLKFLSLPDRELSHVEVRNWWKNFVANTGMKPQTRVMLAEFYKEYNRKLYELLGEGWEGVWDESLMVGDLDPMTKPK